jgi:hypothetical protein
MSPRFIVSSNVCSASDKDGSTILNVERGILYSVIGVASRVWTRLAARPEGVTLDEMIASIRSDFPLTEQKQIKEDLENLLKQLTLKGLVQISNAKSKRIVGFAEACIDTVAQWLPHAIAKTILLFQLDCVAAFLQLAFFDLTLKVGGFRALHKAVKQWPLAVNRGSCVGTIRKLDEALNRAARYYPRHALCLQRSAALTCLLRTSGVPAQMVIACRRMPFKGHAWVEVEQQVVNDSPRVQIVCASVLERC